MNLFFRIPVSINDGKYTWNIKGDKVTHNFECNHKETDTRVILHAAMSSEDVLVVAAGKDVLILMIYAYSKFMGGLTKLGF